MRTPEGSKGPNPLEPSLFVQLFLPTPKKNRLLPSPRHILGRAPLPCGFWDTPRVESGRRGRRQIMVRSGSSRDVPRGDRPNWTDQAGLDRGGGRGGASAASLFAEFARPPSHCFRTRHCPRRSTLDQHFVGCPGATKHGGRKRVGTGMLLLYGSYMYVRSPTAVVPPSKV